MNGQNMMLAGGTVRAGSWPRRALAFVRSAEPRAALSRRAITVDVCLALAGMVAAIAVVKFGSSASSEVVHKLVFPVGNEPHVARRTWPRSSPPVPVSAIAAAVMTTAPLAARRLAPLATFWVIIATAIATSHDASAVTFAAAALAGYGAAVYSRFHGLALLSLPLAGVIVSAAFQVTSPPLPGRITALIVLVAIMIVGNAVHTWKRRARESQARIGHLQAVHQAETRRAVDLERARIASELHDVVTHNVSVMVVQAGAARRVLGASPDEARSALLAVEASGRAAMIELQHLLGLLAPPGEPEAAGLTGAPSAEPLQPQPGLDRLRPLIDRVTAAGLPVEFRVNGAPHELPPGLDLACYRVVQEALTNVIKHAGQARTTVTLDYRPGELVIEIADDGPLTRAAASASPGAGPGRPGTMPGARRGLLGLRERVLLYGGEFDAGRRPGGGWRVRARFPDELLPAGSAALSPAAVGGPHHPVPP